MTYEEFLKIISEIYSENANEFMIEWNKGGFEGGNCWGDEAHEYPGDPEPELDIAFLLDIICPNITFIQYRKVMNDVPIKYDSRYICEYYGNSTHYGIKKISYRDLYDSLKKHGVV